MFQLPFPPLRNLFIPVFLNCWLAKRSLENMFVSIVFITLVRKVLTHKACPHSRCI